MKRFRKLGILALYMSLGINATLVSSTVMAEEINIEEAVETEALPVIGEKIPGGIPEEGIQHLVSFKITDAQTGELLIPQGQSSYKWYIPIYLGIVPRETTTRVKMSYKLAHWEGGAEGKWINVTEVIEEEYDITEGWSFLHIPRQGQTDYTVSIYKKVTSPDPNKSPNNYLSSLEVERGTLTPEFNKENEKYTLEVDEDVDEMTIYAKTEDEKAEVDEKTVTPLSLGLNKISIRVKAENGVNRYYYIYIIRGDANAKEEDEDKKEENNQGSGSNSGRFNTKRDLNNFRTIAYVKKAVNTATELTNTEGLTVEQILAALPITQKEQIYSKLKQRIPYTTMDYKLSSEALKSATTPLFTDEQIAQIIASDTLLGQLGIQRNTLVHTIHLMNTGNVIYSDVPDDHSAKAAIDEAISLGILQATENGKFEPESSIKIEDALKYLDQVLLLNGINEMKLGRSTIELYYNNISLQEYPHIGSIASKLMISTNKILAEKRIGESLSREHLAQIIYEVTDGRLQVGADDVNLEDTTDNIYASTLKYCVQAGLIETQNNNVSPAQNVTKAEMIKILMSLNKALKAMKPVITPQSTNTINTTTNNNNTGTNNTTVETNNTTGIGNTNVDIPQGNDTIANRDSAEGITEIGSKYYYTEIE